MLLGCIWATGHAERWSHRRDVLLECRDAPYWIAGMLPPCGHKPGLVIDLLGLLGMGALQMSEAACRLSKRVIHWWWRLAAAGGICGGVGAGVG